MYNYPIRPWHQAIPSLAAAPAPADIAVQIYNALPRITSDKGIDFVAERICDLTISRTYAYGG